MKKILRPILCGGVLAALLCTPSLAAEPEATVPLLLNGEPVSFSDAAPIFWGDAIDVPAAATLEALGYEITWDEASQTILAEQDGAALSLTIGDATAHRSGTGGSKEIISLSKAPYVDPATWRTYFSAEDLSLLLGDPYRTAVDYGWTMDSAGGLVMSYGEMAVIVDDVDAILAENTETYERMDQYLDYARKYSQGNYQVEGSYLLTSAPGEMESGAEIIHTVGGGYSMVTNQTAMQFAMDMSIGGTIMGAPISPTDMDLDLRADLDTGMLYLYFQSEDLEQLMNNNVQVNGETIEFQIPDQWYSLDMKAVYDEAYGPGFYEELIALSAVSQEAAFAQTLEELLKSDTLILTSTATTSDYLEALNQLLGDSHFQKSGSTYTSILEQDGALVRFHLYTSGGQVNGYGMEMTAADPEAQMTMTMEMKGDDMDLLFQMGGMTMEMDGTYRSTRSAPETEPPAGAKVVDLWELLNTPINEF